MFHRKRYDADEQCSKVLRKNRCVLSIVKKGTIFLWFTFITRWNCVDSRNGNYVKTILFLRKGDIWNADEKIKRYTNCDKNDKIYSINCEYSFNILHIYYMRIYCYILCIHTYQAFSIWYYYLRFDVHS